MDLSEVLLVIPARGGSKGIPRKNVRLLNGRPLISYAIETCFALPGAKTVVSTEDEEIAGVAADYGAMVVDRPACLAADHVSLDEVVLHAWRNAEQAIGRTFQWVVTVQPTTPLLRPDTLRQALDILTSQDVDTVITVVDRRHLYWAEVDGKATPMFGQRLNRQWLPPLWQETGGAVASRRTVLEDGRRIGDRIRLLPVSEEEGLDIDSFDDWVVAEHRLTAPRIAIRVVGNRVLGLGHVYRMLSLAQRLPVSTVTFFTDPHSERGRSLIERSNFRTREVRSNEEFIAAVVEGGYDLVINDILDTDAEYVRALKGVDGRVVVNFEDLGTGAVEATLTINALYEYSSSAPNQRYGWRYVCLRDEFLTARPSPSLPRDPVVVLVTYGGADPMRMTEKAISALRRLPIRRAVHLDVVVGLGNERLESIAQLCRGIQDDFLSVSVAQDVKRMSQLMKKATLALTSNGRTVYELAAMGVPLISVSQNQRETSHTFAKLSRGAVDLGPAALVSVDALAGVLRELLEDESRLQSMRDHLLEFDLRNGTRRVVAEIMNTYHEWRLRSHRSQLHLEVSLP